MLSDCSTDYQRCFFYSVLIGITKEAAIYNKQQERENIFNNCNKLLIKG